MAHKNQHIVPRCYLKNFVRKESNNPENIHHKNGIFVSEKSLKGDWKEKGLDSGIFTSSYFYNLQTDDEQKKLIVEKYLSKVECLYDKSVTNIKTGKINESDIEIIKIFAYFQYIRSLSFQAMMQNAFDQNARWVDEFNGNDDATKEVIDISKKMITTGISEDNIIINQPCLIFLNNTKQNFLTSDNPVVHKIINWRQTSDLIGEHFLTKSYDNSIEKPMFFMPITSTIAIVSSEFIERSAELDKESGLIYVDRLNIQMCLNSEKYVYAENQEPLLDQKSYIDVLDKYFSMQESSVAKIITKDDIYFIDDIYDLNREHFKITFKTRNNHFLNNIAEGTEIKLIEIHTPKGNSGMRDAKIISYNNVNGEIIIEPYFKPKIN
ncbi:TPA: DUF4238 domain-containing protein [Legionella pneumophila]